MKDTFLSPETLKEIQRRFPDVDTHHERNLFEPHPFVDHHYTVYKSRWQQTEGSLREGWD